MVEQVSGTAIAGIIFSMIVSIGLPVFLLFFVKRRLKTRMSAAGIGALTFVLFALILEQILHSVVLNLSGDVLNENIWLYALYGGLAAGVFEETGRFVAMKFWMKKDLSKESSIMYGVGHGGIEAILIAGIGCISNLITVFMINSGQIESAYSTLEDGPGKELALQSLSVFWTTPGYQFFLVGVERAIAIGLHICLSYLVYRAVKRGEKKYFAAAVGIHFLVDALTVVLANFAPIAAVEIALAVMVGALILAVRRMYGKDLAKTEESFYNA